MYINDMDQRCKDLVRSDLAGVEEVKYTWALLTAGGTIATGLFQLSP